MKLIINTAHQRFGGAIQVALSFINECLHFPENQYYVWVGPGVRQSLIEADFPSNFHFQHFDFGVINMRKAFAINRILRRAERGIQPDCIISTSGPSYFHSKAPQIVGFNLPLYIYPESPYLQGLPLSQKLLTMIKKHIHYYFFKRDATAYLVQTDDVNSRVRKALETDNVYTVTNTFSSFYKNWKLLPPKLPPKAPGIFRFVTISAYYPHKNLKIIPDVLKELQKRGCQNVEFVLTLNPVDFQRIIRNEYKGHILNIGPVMPPECPSLYAECDALFLPTLAECFSASYPEAMVMEIPIVTTDLGFARSICGESALYFKAKNAASASDVIERLLKSPELQEELKKEGKEKVIHFDTPAQRARKYLAICKQFANSSKSFEMSQSIK